METKDWLPLIGVIVGAVLGWFLNQLGQWMNGRRDEKKAIARAISNLLEIRHHLLAFPKATEVLSEHFGLPREHHTLFKVALSQLFPPDSDLSKRYSDAVNLVADQNPILGFRLRSQDRVIPLLDNLRKIALNDPNAIKAMPALEQELLGQLTPLLDKLLRELASAHGVITSFAVRRQLKREMELPADLLASLKARLIPQATHKEANDSQVKLQENADLP